MSSGKLITSKVKKPSGKQMADTVSKIVGEEVTKTTLS